MIGRLGWLAAGVVVGVSGYRRVSRLARSVRPAAAPARAWAAIRPGRPGARPPGRTGPFVADVRDGMQIYLDRHPRRPGRSLGGQQVTPRLAGQPGRTGGYLPTDNAKEGR